MPALNLWTLTEHSLQSSGVSAQLSEWCCMEFQIQLLCTIRGCCFRKSLCLHIQWTSTVSVSSGMTKSRRRARMLSVTCGAVPVSRWGQRAPRGVQAFAPLLPPGSEAIIFPSNWLPAQHSRDLLWGTTWTSFFSTLDRCSLRPHFTDCGTGSNGTAAQWRKISYVLIFRRLKSLCLSLFIWM